MNRFTSTIGLLVLAGRLAGFAAEPLDQWLWRNPLPNGNEPMAVTYANGLFVAVGGALAASADGTNWVSRNLGPVYGVGVNYAILGTAWGNGLWVGVGLGNQLGGAGDFPVLWTSPDLITWTPQALPVGNAENPDGIVDDLFAVVYANGLFVAAGGGHDPVLQRGFGAILTSTDGVHWTQQRSGTSDNSLSEIVYGNGLFVVASGSGTILVSPDAVNWSTKASGGFGGIAVTGLAYARGLYLAVGPLGIRASTDGAAWTNRVSSLDTQAIAYGNGLFVAVSSGGQVQTSADGLKWTRRGTTGAGNLMDLSYGNGLFVAVGTGALLVSTNGLNWLNLVSAVTTTILEGAAYGQGTFVAVGFGGTILHSTDGARWSLSASTQSADLFSVAYGGGIFVATGQQGTILASTNGLDWFTATNTGTGAFLDVTYGDGQFVAVGTGGAILTATNGTAWMVQDSGLAPDLQGLAYGNGLFVAGAGAGVLTSPDGVAWTEQALNVPGAGIVGLGYGNGVFVAVGGGGLILTSTNAVDWVTNSSGTSADLYRVSYGDGTFLVTGSPGALLTSTNGSDWMLREDGTETPLYAAAFGRDTFVAVGNGGAILQSGVMPPIVARLSPTPGWTNGAFGLSLSAPLGGKWDLQASTNLLDWTTLGTLTITNSQMPFLDPGAADLRQRFYRAVSR